MYHNLIKDIVSKFIIVLILLLNASFVQAADIDTLSTVYNITRKEYIEDISIAKIATLSLKGINKLDKNLKIADDNKRMTIYYKSKVVKSFLKPENENDLEAWVKLSDKIIREAMESSPQVAKKDFELVDTMLVYAFENLDTDSHYYPDVESKDNKIKYRRNFADRVIDNVLYLKLLSFNKYTRQSVIDAIDKNPDVKGVILDLRGNNGGILGEAIEITNIFLDEGIIVSTKGRRADSTKFYMAEAGDKINNKPMVVLIDGQTASSAEVVTASLHEQGRAKVVGTSSFGKGSVQNLIAFDNGSALALTSAYFYTPAGMKITGDGLQPDVCTFEMPDTKNMDNLLAIKRKEKCPKEARLEKELEINTALRLINDSLK